MALHVDGDGINMSHIVNQSTLGYVFMLKNRKPENRIAADTNGDHIPFFYCWPGSQYLPTTPACEDGDATNSLL